MDFLSGSLFASPSLYRSASPLASAFATPGPAPPCPLLLSPAAHSPRWAASARTTDRGGCALLTPACPRSLVGRAKRCPAPRRGPTLGGWHPPADGAVPPPPPRRRTA